MEERRYKVLISDYVVAENMDIEIATTLVEALFEKYDSERSITVSIKEMERCEAFACTD